MMKKEEIEDEEDELDGEEKKRRKVGMIQIKNKGMKMDEEYEVKEEWVKKKIEDGRRVIGWKIGIK